jgi:hypothetical protein
MQKSGIVFVIIYFFFTTQSRYLSFLTGFITIIFYFSKNNFLQHNLTIEVNCKMIDIRIISFNI